MTMMKEEEEEEKCFMEIVNETGEKGGVGKEGHKDD